MKFLTFKVFVRKLKIIFIYLRSMLLLVIALYFFIIPFGLLVYDLRDPGLYNGQIPQFTYRWHRQLSKNFVPWANERVESKKAVNLEIHDISGTEWPMFSAVTYLWATEALQDDWERNPSVSSIMPKDYGRPAIEAAARLISDPGNADWVKEHWGDNYLHQENVFYRMLLIAGLTSYQTLLGDKEYQLILLDQVNSLSSELEASPYGLLDDYPGECYPVDILPAIAVIQRADAILGTDHSSFVSNSLRAFEGERLDAKTSLPAYYASSKTGQGYGSARGVGISFMLIWAPELWPDTARQWYAQYEKFFWNDGLMISGFREFPSQSGLGEYFVEVDAGPVISGYGVGASAFGIAAARANNEFQHAYPLAAEALVASWPLPNGSLLIPKLLSNLSDAPYIGEAALLFTMTRVPVLKSTESKKTSLPGLVYLLLFFYLSIGLVLLRQSILIILTYYKLRVK